MLNVSRIARALFAVGALSALSVSAVASADDVLETLHNAKAAYTEAALAVPREALASFADATGAATVSAHRICKRTEPVLTIEAKAEGSRYVGVFNYQDHPAVRSMNLLVTDEGAGLLRSAQAWPQNRLVLEMLAEELLLPCPASPIPLARIEAHRSVLPWLSPETFLPIAPTETREVVGRGVEYRFTNKSEALKVEQALLARFGNLGSPSQVERSTQDGVIRTDRRWVAADGESGIVLVFAYFPDKAIFVAAWDGPKTP